MQYSKAPFESAPEPGSNRRRGARTDQWTHIDVSAILSRAADESCGAERAGKAQDEKHPHVVREARPVPSAESDLQPIIDSQVRDQQGRRQTPVQGQALELRLTPEYLKRLEPGVLRVV